MPLAYTVVLAGWDAEEVGLTGSYDWVARHRDRLGDVVANVNLEMTAAEAGAPALRFGTSGAAMTSLVRAGGSRERLRRERPAGGGGPPDQRRHPADRHPAVLQRRRPGLLDLHLDAVLPHAAGRPGACRP